MLKKTSGYGSQVSAHGGKLILVFGISSAHFSNNNNKNGYFGAMDWNLYPKLTMPTWFYWKLIFRNVIGNV